MLSGRVERWKVGKAWEGLGREKNVKELRMMIRKGREGRERNGRKCKVNRVDCKQGEGNEKEERKGREGNSN